MLVLPQAPLSALWRLACSVIVCPKSVLATSMVQAIRRVVLL